MPSIDTTTQSPNRSSRNGHAVSMLVLHATVGSYGSALSWLCNPASKVSSHFLISKLGHIAQLVPDTFAAWHAGTSSWRGLTSDAIQACSLGIELENLTGMEGFKGQDPYPVAQIDAAVWLFQQKIAQYHIPREMVTRHLDIAPGRKTDPAGFLWTTFVDRMFAPPLAPHTWRLKGLPIYQRQDLTGAVAGYIADDAPRAIDVLYPNRAGHLMSGDGFIDMNGMEPL